MLCPPLCSSAVHVRGTATWTYDIYALYLSSFLSLSPAFVYLSVLLYTILYISFSLAHAHIYVRTHTLSFSLSLSFSLPFYLSVVRRLLLVLDSVLCTTLPHQYATTGDT